jgi:hypothetical protein
VTPPRDEKLEPVFAEARHPPAIRVKAPSHHAGVTEGAIEMMQPTLTGDWRYMRIVAE